MNTNDTELMSDLQKTRKPLSIALVGMMGVGKTTVGRRLAKRLGLHFHDSDEEIEKASGRSVAGYFKDHGEAAFREGECKVVDRLLSASPILLATGGGAFINENTRKVLKSKAITIWLKADLDTIYERVGRSNSRPLLNVEDPKDVLKTLIEARHPIYAGCDITVDANKGPHIRTVDVVLNALNDYKAAEKAAREVSYQTPSTNKALEELSPKQ